MGNSIKTIKKEKWGKSKCDSCNSQNKLKWNINGKEFFFAICKDCFKSLKSKHFRIPLGNLQGYECNFDPVDLHKKLMLRFMKRCYVSQDVKNKCVIINFSGKVKQQKVYKFVLKQYAIPLKTRGLKMSDLWIDV